MIKIGVIGAGYWGPKLARNFHQIPHAELKWICDTNLKRLDHIQSLYPYVRITSDYHTLLKSDVDAIVIATPVSSHSKLAIEAMRAGKHVLVEKPLAASVAEAETMVAVAEQEQVKLMVGHTFEYNPAVIAVRDLVQSGELGQIYYINAVRVNLGLFQQDINVVWDLAPHDVSILRFILGMNPTSVCASGHAYVQRAKNLHDIAYVTTYFPNDVMATTRVSWLDPRKIRQYTIVGSEKMLVYDDIADDKVLLYNKGVEIPPYSDTEEEFHLSYFHGEGTPYPIQWQEPLRVECEHFIECISNNTTPRSDGYAGLEVVRVLEAAQESLTSKGLNIEPMQLMRAS